jgi:hypothetical protein
MAFLGEGDEHFQLVDHGRQRDGESVGMQAPQNAAKGLRKRRAKITSGA